MLLCQKSKNPKQWKKLKNKFDTGRLSFECQFYNGINIVNENILRELLYVYNRRYLQYGPKSMPLNFNFAEPFFNFNINTSIIELVLEEESYGVSLEDFLDEITSENFKFNKIDLYEEIPEDVVYHFKFINGVFDYPFQCEDSNEYFIGNVSVIRRGDEVSVLMHAGCTFSEEDARNVIDKYTKEKINDNIAPNKKQLGYKFEGSEEARIVNYLEREDLWLHLIAVKFNIDTKTIDIRSFSKDCNIVYEILTDDFNVMRGHDGKTNKELIEYYIDILKKLEMKNGVFEFAKYCMVLPKYVFDREKHIIAVDYPTNLSDLISGPLSRRKFRNVPLSMKIFAKPIYYLESPLTSIKKMKSVRDDSFQIEKSGYWKRLGIDEKGLDKKGREIIGKTWVERNETYYVEKEGVVNVKPKVVYNEVNSGLIYIMRQPAFDKDVYKIGLTRKSTEKRSKDLSNTSVPDNFLVVVDYNVRDCVKAEKLIHQKLQDFRLTDRREFFKCELKYIIEVCEEVITGINKIF